MHVICRLAIFAILPCSRLIHFFGLPLTWFPGPFIVYRRHYDNA
ncbi:MAG: respiratory nitrate reductase subunit gamma [Desulfovibrio sp.]|nr:respiratory nitrate reductase subunit gamma [Desulfovibrio sp.]